MSEIREEVVVERHCEQHDDGQPYSGLEGCEREGDGGVKRRSTTEDGGGNQSGGGGGHGGGGVESRGRRLAIPWIGRHV